MNCPRCSEKVASEDRFCPNCAFPLHVEEEKTLPPFRPPSDLPDLAPSSQPQESAYQAPVAKPAEPDWSVYHTDQPLPKKVAPPKIKGPVLSAKQKVIIISTVIFLLILSLIIAYTLV